GPAPLARRAVPPAAGPGPAAGVPSRLCLPAAAGVRVAVRVFPSSGIGTSRGGASMGQSGAYPRYFVADEADGGRLCVRDAGGGATLVAFVSEQAAREYAA